MESDQRERIANQRAVIISGCVTLAAHVAGVVLLLHWFGWKAIIVGALLSFRVKA